MDVRFFNFPARQRSAKLIERSSFCGLPKRGIALILVQAIFWQPLLAQADGIAVIGTTNTTMGQAGNGVPIVNITAPNASGLSHNQYQQYNVGAQGVILNNATDRTQSTQLGGIILGNQNLNGRAASTILNEVVGANATQLKGYTEVAGQSARVIVANPYGISCNGCGFINTPQVTLTTGKPVLDNGRLDHFRVEGGSVSIDGAGLSADNVDQFDIITRSAKINAELHAKKLNVVTGRNDVDAQSLNATALADDGSAKPQLAIDSSALGGMYAGAIRLVGTEAGVGVKLAGNLAASAGDIQIDANGQLSMAQVAANGSINVKAASADVQGAIYGNNVDMQTRDALSVQQNIAAPDRISLSSNGQLNNNAIVEAGVNADNSRNATGDVALNAQNLRNNGSVIASRDLDASTRQNLDNSGRQITAGGNLALSVRGTLNNQSGLVSATGLSQIVANTVENGSGRIASKSDLNATLTTLNNQKGELVAQGNLTLKGSQLDNRTGGLVGATKALNLDLSDIDNRGGEISSQIDVRIKAGQLYNSQVGKLLSGGAMALNIANVFNQNNGLIYAGRALRLDGGLLNNGGGTLSGQTDLSVNLTGDLDNSNGLLSSEGTLNVGANNLTNTTGKLSSAGALKVVATGAVNNQQGSVSTNNTLTLTSASLDNRNHGAISGKGATVVNSGAFDNSHQGQLTSVDTLSLTAAQVTNQDSGRISAAKAVTARVTGLDQQGGELFSNSTLTLDLNHGQLNNQNGLINAPGALLLKNLAGVNSQSGEISSALGFEFNADSLDNSNGKLLSNQDLIVRVAQALNNVKGMIAAASLDAQAGTLDNTGGTLTSRSDLTLNVNGLLSNDSDSLINAAQALNVQANGINNVGGTLLGTTAVNLDLNGADLDNSNGLITTLSPLNINHLRDLKNANGEISSSQSFSLAGRTLDNSSGKLISNQTLTLNANSLLNQLGLISGWEGLDLSSGSLDNRNGGTLSSRNGDVGVSLTDALLNAANGALVSQKALNISAASVDNRGGILSSGAGQAYNVSGLLDNGQNGLIDSGAALTINAATLGNATGTINALQALSFTGTDLNNSAGSIASNAAVTLDLLGNLINTNGKLASAGDLLISRATQINNQGGQLASQRALTLFTGGLDNSNRGTVASNDQLLLTARGAIQNANDSLIYSKNANLTVQAASLANGKSTLQSQGALDLVVSGDIDSQSGKIIAQGGNLNVAASNVDNRGGVLSSLQSAFTARISGVLKNGYDPNNNSQGGITQAQSLDIRALAGVDNYGGRLSAQSGNALIYTGSGNFDNRNGGLYAKQRVIVTANNFHNSGSNDGQIAGQQIDLTLSGALNNQLGIIESESTLNITAASLNNQTGKLRALGTSGVTRFQTGGLLDNRNGTLETANTNLALGVGSLLNAGGSILHVGSGNFGVSTTNVINAGGSFITRGALTLDADSWTNSSIIQAGMLNVNVGNFTQTASGQLLASTALVGTGGNWTNDGLIASDGTLSLTFSGSYTGNGRVSSLDTLGLSTAQLALGSAASIAGGARTTINIAGTATNYGRLTSSADLVFNAGSLANYGTLGAALNLTLTTPALSNSQGLIFSGADMQVNTATLTNLKGDFYSLKNLTVGGYGAARANQVSNISGSMESGSKFTISATAFENRTEGSDGTQNFAVGRTLVSGFITVQCIDCSGDHYEVNYIARETYDAGQDSDTSASALLTAGNDFSFSGSNFLNNKSNVSAGGNISIQADNVKNIGAVSGTVERTRMFSQGVVTDGTVTRFMPEVVAYNQRDNPDFPKIYYVASSGELRLGVVTFDTGREPGHDGGLIKVTNVKDSETGENVSALTVSGYAWESTPASQYDPANLLQLPAALSGMALVSDVEVAKDGTGNAGRSAVIQAGGNVSINATQNMQNSVIHEDYASAGGTNKVADTHANGTSTTVVVRLNAQIPPDLAQQQVEPTSLPGFSLPTGQNGLFRLSAEGGTQASTAPQNWSIGSASVSAAQRDQTLPGTSTRDILIGNAGDPGATGHVVTVADRQDAGVTGKVSSINVASGEQDLTRVQGLPSSAGKPGAGKYLIETNPVLTVLKQFMSSDYLLAGLGYDPDVSAKRLGDGFYEQRLVQQAVTARTGQAFIDGQTSNEDQFKHLMNNAIASKDALNLSVGVSLTSEQVAALTHDIVWLEEHEVNGEKVLVPVLYLAQADNRLAPNGAMIAGKDVTLIAGQNLDNVGTLKASNNLSAVAGNDLVNSGLVAAGNRLDLLAGNDITNKAGGIIAGRDVTVTVTAIGGDVTNERTITSLDSDARGQLHKNYADTAARIEAANDLSVSAGRDINNIGSTLQSGRDLTLNAGRDVNIASTQVTNSLVLDSKHTSSDITQVGATVSAGRDLSVQAGRDVNAIASQIDAKRDIAIAATKNVTIRSAADEDHFLSKSKKLTVQEDHVSQVATDIKAGGSVAVTAGQNLAVISSRITAGEEAYLVAGAKLDILAAQDSDYSLYDKKQKGSFGAKKTKRDEVTQVTYIGSEITSGGNMMLVSGGDQHYQVAKLNGGNDLTLNSGGSILFEGVKDLHQESHEKSKSDLAWNSMSGKGSTDETLRQSGLIAKGNLAIKAVDGLRIDVKQVNQQTVSEAIDAMVSANPDLAWLKDAEKRGDVDWRQVQEIHQSFKYSHSGLGVASQLALAIVLAALTGGAGAALVGASAGTFSAGLANAALVSLEVTAANSAISNKGNLGAVVKDTFSKGNLQSAATSGLTAGFINYASSNWFGASMDPATGKITGPSVVPSLMDPAALARFTSIQLAGGAVNGALSEALGTGTFKDSMVGSVFTVLQATAFNGVGDIGKKFDLPESGAAKIALHAVVGGLLSEVMGGDFKTGAAAAGANEALIEYLDKSSFLKGADGTEHDRMVNAASKLVGLFAAAAVGSDVSPGSELAGNAQSYNRKLHTVEKEMLVAEADKLDKQSKSASGLSWDTLLNLVAGADVDALETARLTAVLSTSGDSNPEKVRLLEDLQLAESVINKLKSEKIQLTWADGTPIVAHGDGVYAFASSAAQYNDSSLFNANHSNSTSGDDFGSIPVEWVNQFGPAAALQYQNEIGPSGTSTWQNQDAYQQMTTILDGGIVPVLSEKDILLAMAGGAGAKSVLGLLGELRGVKLAGERAEHILASGGAKGTPAWDNAIAKADGDFGYLPPVRQNYVKDVYDLQGIVDRMRASGASAEDVAKYAYGARNELKMKYRKYTPPETLDVIDARNLERYNNKVGPTFDDLVKKGKTFDQIIESSTRAGGGDLFQ